ncbi:hypothetical protein Dimus_013618 [Dionaea muscipula]
MKDHHDDDDNDNDDDDDDMDDAPQGGHDGAQPDEQKKIDEDNKAQEESDDDIPLSKRFPSLTSDSFQKKAVVEDEVVEVENLEKEDEDADTFKLEEDTVFVYKDEEGNIIQLDQENLEAMVDMALEDTIDKLMNEMAQKVVDEDAAEKEKEELAQIAALAAKFDEEDAQAEAAVAAKAKKTKTYSRKRKVRARKSARSVKRKLVLEEEEETEEVVVEKPKDVDVGTSSRDVVEEVLERQLVVYQGGLSTPVAEPILHDDADFISNQPADVEKNADLTAFCALFEESIKTTMGANEQQTQILSKMWTELKGFTNFDKKLKGDLALTWMRMEQDNEKRADVMKKTLKILKLIPKTLETHRDFLHNRIREVITTNLNDSKVVKHQIEAAEKNTDGRLDARRLLEFGMKEFDEFGYPFFDVGKWNKASFADAFFYFCRDRVKSKGILKLMQSTLHKRNSSTKADRGIINPYMSSEEFAKGFKAGAWGSWPDEIAFEA